MNNKKRTEITNGLIYASEGAKEAYETKVAMEALNRAGKCPNLHGHVHEILFKDQFNMNPKNIVQGKTAHLTKSNTAQMKDIILKQNNKVIGHAQLKDTTSASGLNKTIQQINKGYYNKTKVLGTKETVKGIGDKVSQKVHSSNISSETTKRIANKALGKMPSGNVLGSAAKSGGVAGAAIGAGVEAVCSIKDVCNGTKSVGEAAGDVVVAGIKGGVTGAASTVASTVAAGAATTAISTAAATTVGTAIAGTAAGAAAIAAAPAVIGIGAAVAVGSFISSLFD